MGSLKTLEDERHRLIDQALAKNTHNTYSAAWKKFEAFCTLYKRPIDLPISINDLSLFIAYLSKLGFASSTVATYVAGLAHFHKIQGLPDPSCSFIVQKMLEGLKRGQRGKSDTRLPITANYLEPILNALSSICSSDYEITLFKAAFSLSFFGFLRIGEVAAQSVSNVSEHVLRKNDVSFRVWEDKPIVVINFRISKNNQSGEPQSVCILKQENQAICPLSALQAYMSQASSSPTLFSHFNGLPLTKFQFSSVLSKAIAFSSIPNHQLYKSHSFRIGAATSAKLAGYSETDIQTMGRWHSAAFKRYIRIPLF